MKVIYPVLIAMLFFVPKGYGQSPKSDREDDGYKGRIQKIVVEKAKLSNAGEGWVESERELSEVITYDASGDLIKRETYDKVGLLETETYGYLEGDRVEKTETAPGRVLPGGGGPAPRRDPRYSIKFKYKYDVRGDRIEVVRLLGDESVASRSVRVYDAKGNRVEERTYHDGSLSRKVTNLYDDRGNVTESSEDLAGDRFDSRYCYTYDFDALGNWTKRVVARWVTKEGKSFFEPYHVTYRTITYF